MALRGETVGTAFVRILADGSGLDQSIKDSMREREGVFEQAGREDSQGYLNAFDEEMRKRPPLRQLEEDIRAAAGRFDAIGNQVGDNFGDGFLHRIDTVFRTRFGPEVGDRLSQGLREALTNEQDINAIQRFVDDLGKHVVSVTRTIQTEEKNAANEAERAWRRSMANIDSEITRLTRSVETEAGRMGRAFRSTGDALETGFVRAARQFQIDVEKIGTDSVRLRREFERTKGDISGLSDVFGRAFGKGSRNNFVNFFGSLVSGMTNIVEKIPGVRSLLGGLSDAFDEAERSGEGFFKTIFSNGAADGFAILAQGVVGLGISLGALVAIASPVVSLFAGLAGGIIAMASSILFAAAAAIPILVGGLGAIAGLVGAAVIGFQGLSKQMKKTLSEDAKPLISTFKDLSKEIAGPLFHAIDDAFPLLNRALKSALPFAKGVGKALGDVVDGLAHMVNDPAFDKFIKAFGTFLPGAIRDLGKIAVNLGDSLAGLFRASIPLTKDFLGWLVEITRKFADWINSAKGQKAVKQFFDRAAESARIVGKLIGKIAEAIGTLADAGKGSGDDLFTQLTGTVQDFIDFLNNNPKAVSNWFADAEDITNRVGKALLLVVDVLDQLDDPQVRDALVLIFDILSKITSVIGPIEAFSKTGFGEELAHAVNVAVNPIQTLYNLLQKIPEAIDAVKGAFRDAFTAISNFFTNFGTSFTPAKFAGLIPGAAIAKSILDKIGKINISDLVSVAGVIGKIVGGFAGTVKSILGAVGTFFVRDIINIGGVISKVLGAFPSPHDIIDKMKFDLIEVVGGLTSLAAKVLNAFPSAGEIVNFIGTITIPIHFDVPDIHIPGTGFSVNPGGLWDAATSHLPFAGGGADQQQKPPFGRVPQQPLVGQMTIVTPSDPLAVANEVLNALAGQSYVA